MRLEVDLRVLRAQQLGEHFLLEDIDAHGSDVGHLLGLCWPQPCAQKSAVVSGRVPELTYSQNNRSLHPYDTMQT